VALDSSQARWSAQTTIAMRSVYVIVTLLWLSACGGRPCQLVGFERWRDTDKVVVKSNANVVLREITNKDAISELVGFAVAHSDDWTAPWYGTPVPSMTAEFYRGTQFLGHLGVGNQFLETQGCDDFVSRKISASEYQSAMKLVEGSSGSNHH
jgi:hypothetical protein